MDFSDWFLRTGMSDFKKKSCEVIIGLLHYLQDWEQFFYESKANKSNGQHQESQQDQNTFVNGLFDISDIKHLIINSRT